MKELFSEKIALFSLFILVITPWHFMNARWAFESNRLTSIFIIALYFLVRGFRNNRYLIISAFFWGLALYCYALSWVVIPIFLLYCMIYGIKYHRFTNDQGKISVFAWVSTFVLALMALPLILFLLVNYDIIPEIRTSVISIPHLLGIRIQEFNISNMISGESFVKLIRWIVFQNDHMMLNGTCRFGLFYKFSLPFIGIGFIIK